jgi:FixJ family two-component response regulator
METRATRMRDRENNIIALLGITRDITDKKRAEEAEQTDFAERLNSLSDRERETLDILITGYTAKEAALVLGISHRNC